MSFADRIRTTEFTNPEVDSLFRVTGSPIFSDFTMLATLRAVVNHRLGEDDSLTMRYAEISTSCESMDELAYETCMAFSSSYKLFIINVSESRIPDKYKKLFEEAGWERIEKMTAFFEKALDVQCFKNDALKSTVLFTARLSVVTMHFIQMAIPAFLPWYFGTERRLNDEERALLHSCGERNSKKYLECLHALAEEYDFYSARLVQLEGFETLALKQEYKNLTDEVRSAMERVECLTRELGEAIENKDRTERQAWGVLAAIDKAGEQSEFKEYFLKNRKRFKLVRMDTDGRTLEFECMGYADNFDDDFAKKIIANKHSELYTRRGSRPRVSSKRMARLFEAIFVTREVRLKLCGVYIAQIARKICETRSGYEYDEACIGYLPNPHLNHHRCLGAYGKIFAQFLQQANYIGFMEQAMASCESVNLNEPPTFGPFMEDLYQTEIKCIEFPDGRCMAPYEAANELFTGEDDGEEEVPNESEDED